MHIETFWIKYTVRLKNYYFLSLKILINVKLLLLSYFTFILPNKNISHLSSKFGQKNWKKNESDCICLIAHEMITLSIRL